MICPHSGSFLIVVFTVLWACPRNTSNNNFSMCLDLEIVSANLKKVKMKVNSSCIHMTLIVNRDENDQAELAIMLQEVQECQEPLRSIKSNEDTKIILSWSLQRECGPTNTWFLVSWNQGYEKRCLFFLTCQVPSCLLCHHQRQVYSIILKFFLCEFTALYIGRQYFYFLVHCTL